MSYASFVHALTRFTWRFGRVFIPLWIAFAAVFTAAAAADALWHFGWGYRLQDALLGSGMIVFGILFWLVWNWMFKLQRRVNEAFFGPDQEREADKEG